MPDVIQTNAVLLSPDGTGSASYRLTPAGPLFRRYATRSLEESCGLVPPCANGCDEVLSICKVACVFEVACTRQVDGRETALFSKCGWPKFIFCACDRTD